MQDDACQTSGNLSAVRIRRTGFLISLRCARLPRYNLDTFFPAETAVWSACRLSKTDVFVRAIQAHLSAHGHLEAARCYGVGSSNDTLPEGFLVAVIGDGTEEEAAARRLQFPFVKVCSARDLSKVDLYLAGAGAALAGK